MDDAVADDTTSARGAADSRAQDGTYYRSTD